jgi:hypothetical protein
MSTLKQITDLDRLDQQQLKSKWRELFGQEPPAYRRGFLIKGLAYRIQELSHGGLSENTRTRIEELKKEQATSKKTARRSPKHTPITGTRLIREWQGVRHEVTVVHNGFEYQGKTYKSLSVIARTITGTRWSGPLFFGLRNHGKTTTLTAGEAAS